MTQEKGTTRDLLLRVHQGDEKAISRLLTLHLSWLEKTIRSSLSAELRRHGETGDYLQDVVIQVLRHGPRFVISDETQFRALLARMVKNLLIDKSRWARASRRDWRKEQKGAGPSTTLSLDFPSPHQAGPGTNAGITEEQDLLRLAIELLPDQDRQVVLMREIEDSTFAEIGEQLRITAEGARGKHERALAHLARIAQRLKRGEIQSLLEEKE